MSGKGKLFSMKLKLCVGVLATAAAAVAVIFFVSLSRPVSPEEMENRASHKRSLDNSFAASEPEVAERHRRSLVRAGTSSRQDSSTEIDCRSLPNNTIPAAHIKGRGRFVKSTGDSRVPGYKQAWTCSDIDPAHPQHPVHAFVDGGMSFHHHLNRIYVPTCGYYHISSQILFEFNKKSTNGYTHVSHLLKFQRNCHANEDNGHLVVGISSIHPGNSTTTFASDVVKLCAGGSIWVEIHETNDKDLYPRGDHHGTFITAVLVAQTSCLWPPTTIMEDSDLSHD